MGESVTSKSGTRGDEQSGNILFSSAIVSISRAGLSERYTRASLFLGVVTPVGVVSRVLEVLD